MFAGWNAMKNISLTWTFISDSDLALIISSCGALESLYLDGCDGFEKIVVCAPKLLKFDVYSLCEISISLDNAPSIIDFGLSLWCLMWPPEVEHGGQDLFEILMNIPLVEFLTLVYHQEIFEDIVPVVKERIQLPQCLPSDHLLRNLSTLRLALCLTDADLLPIISCLLSSSPNLNKLIINDDPRGIISETDSAYWERHPVTECMKHHLSYVELEDANLDSESVTKFMKFLLSNVSALKRMTVTYLHYLPQPSSVESDRRCLQWASSHAVLKFDRSQNFDE